MAPEKIKKNTTKAKATKAAPKKAPVKTVEKKESAPRAASGLSANIYSATGKDAGTIELSEAIFGQRWNNNLVHQVVVSMQANARAGRGLAHTKDRSEVRGGGKKPWKQKGTGQARHGSSRSPIWVGGGITHGPRKDKDYSKRIPRNMRIAALRSVLSRKFKDGEILFVEKISFANPKTKDAKAALEGWSSVKGFEKLTQKRTNAAFLALSANDVMTKKSFRNFGTIEVDELRNLNALDALSATFLIIEDPKEALKSLDAKLS